MNKCVVVAIAMCVASGTLATEAKEDTLVMQRFFPNLVVRAFRDSQQQFSIRLTRAGQSEVSVQLQSLDGLQRVELWNDSKLIVLGSLAHATVLAIISATDGSIQDTFLGLNPSLSDDNRFLAYTKAVPRTSEDEGNALYLVYDVSQSKLQNRMPGTSAEDEQRAGIAVFPTWNRQEQSYSTVPAEAGPPHDRHSPVVWLDSRTLAFLDFAGTTLSLVVAELHAGTRQPYVRSMPIGVAQFFDSRMVDQMEPGTVLASLPIAEAILPLEVRQGFARVRIRLLPSSWQRIREIDVEL